MNQINYLVEVINAIPAFYHKNQAFLNFALVASMFGIIAYSARKALSVRNYK